MRVTGDGGVEIEVFLDGPDDGQPVLFMHGWPDSHRLWRHQVKALSDAGFRTIAPDLRGFGDSDKPTDVGAYKIAHTVADMIAILDALDVAQTHVVCHDWGALGGWGLTAFFPDRVSRLAALSVGHPKAFADAGFAQRMRSLYMLLFNLEEIAEEWFHRYGEEMLAQHRDRDAVIEELNRPGALTASFGWYRANAHPRTIISAPPEIPAIRCPVMGVWGRGETALTEAQMTYSENYVEGPWRYERLENAAHWMQLDAPDEVNALLLDFLS
jgi:pimeloyl-ACP methyl ester carboxylesterase